MRRTKGLGSNDSARARHRIQVTMAADGMRRIRPYLVPPLDAQVPVDPAGQIRAGYHRCGLAERQGSQPSVSTRSIAPCLRAVSDYEQSRGAEHPRTLSARDELAAAYQAAGDIAAAGRHAVRRATPRGFGAVLGRDHTETLARC